jgi:FixJ family two-component response regulator
MNDFSKLHASIVDDQDVELFITEKLLRLNKLAGKIEIFRSGQEFIDAFNEKNHIRDYVLINFRMPVTN